MGRIRRLLQQDRPVIAMPDLICPLCERKIPPSQRDAHHLVPKSKGGRHTEYLHRICHRQIHALYTETEWPENSTRSMSCCHTPTLHILWLRQPRACSIPPPSSPPTLACTHPHERDRCTCIGRLESSNSWSDCQGGLDHCQAFRGCNLLNFASVLHPTFRRFLYKSITCKRFFPKDREFLFYFPSPPVSLRGELKVESEFLI